MIKLLENTDFEVKKDSEHILGMVVLKDDITTIIRRKLQLASSKHELIYTNDLRGIGKTYQLIKFAKLHNYSVIVNSIGMAEQLKINYKFPYIYSQQQVFNKELSDENILVDEGVDFKRINDEGHYNIITGFSHIYVDDKSDDKGETFNKEIVGNLKNEILSLNKSIAKARENGEYSMYKNLINSYRDVVRLIQDLDWQFKYSEYSTEVSNGVFQKQVAIWQQNSEGIIKNHKKWNIESNCNK